jgi:hypothetical protein
MRLQWQQQQQQQQRRMQQQRQMGYAWQQWQRAKERAREDGVQPAVVPLSGQAMDRFSQVEAEVASLRQQMAAGRLTEAQLRKRLEQLMIQDAQGYWWMIALEADQWYRYDGEKWVPGVPPRLAAASGLQSSAKVRAVSTSGVVYLYGDRFVPPTRRPRHWSEIPCRGVKVDALRLAETALATAFIALDRSGHGRLHIGTRPGALGISRNRAVCMELCASGIGATGLEGRILASVRTRKTRNNAFDIVRRIGAHNNLPRLARILALIKEELIEQGHFGEEAGARLPAHCHSGGVRGVGGEHGRRLQADRSRNLRSVVARRTGGN